MQHFGQIIVFTQRAAQCLAGGMEQYALQELLVNLVATVTRFGLTIDLLKHVAECLAGEVIHVALQELLVNLVAMVIVGSGNG